MYKWLVPLAIIIWSCVAAAVPDSGPSSDAIVGTWLTEKQDCRIEIDKSGSAYVGKVVWLKATRRDGKPALDAKNTENGLRGRPILDLQVLSGFAYIGDHQWGHGKLYSPLAGRSFPGELSLLNDNRLDVEVKDGIFFKHVIWTRVVAGH